MALFGPDGTRPIDFRAAPSFVAAPGQRLLVRFNFSAVWENAVLLYSAQTMQLLSERGNYSRPATDFITDNSGRPEPLTILVTAWHKASQPDGGVPWQQSVGFRLSNLGTTTVIGFNDGGNNYFFENAVAIVTPLN